MRTRNTFLSQIGSTLSRKSACDRETNAAQLKVVNVQDIIDLDGSSSDSDIAEFSKKRCRSPKTEPKASKPKNADVKANGSRSSKPSCKEFKRKAQTQVKKVVHVEKDVPVKNDVQVEKDVPVKNNVQVEKDVPVKNDVQVNVAEIKDKNEGEIKTSKRPKTTSSSHFCGDPVAKSEAIRRWPHRYPKVKSRSQGNANYLDHEHRCEDKVVTEAIAHFVTAEVDGNIYKLGDCVHVNSDGGPDYIGRIIELFESTDGDSWFTTQWFYRPHDTAIGQDEAKGHVKKRIFLSTIKDDNLLECITGKVNIMRVPVVSRFESKSNSFPPCDYYYDMGYDIAFSAFHNLPDEISGAEMASSDSASTVSSDDPSNLSLSTTMNVKSEEGSTAIEPELSLLDLYSGCGAMSTGLCMGASLSGVKLVTRWAIDLNQHACESLKHNHPETEVRNESAENFLSLLKEWEKLCKKYLDCGNYVVSTCTEVETCNSFNTIEIMSDSDSDGEVFEVEELIGIRWGTDNSGKSGLEFKVRWKGYGKEDDTWEAYDGLMGCQERLKDFVNIGRRKRILPLPGDVDVICGGPPCQGASGFNRFRNVDAPLDDPRNHQIVVFMDIVDYLRPRFVLMENVVDILKFSGGLLGRYALSRLVKMHFQAKLGLMIAGCYGLPQFRMRAFLWGASPQEKLPPFPLPTHDVVVRGSFPLSWEHNSVAYDETNRPELHEAVVLADAISDLPPVKNSEKRDEILYNTSSETEFQRFMRLSREALEGKNCAETKMSKQFLFDHRPLELNADDLERTCRIPKRKGANFRDLEGVIVRPDNTVELDVENRAMLPSGKPLVPDYAISFVHGRSLKPFGRLWWDEIVPTVVTRAEPHNQVILHPVQDRVLTIRENARIQGFPDYYKLFGPVKQRYMQVGNAVAVPVAKVLGYELGLAIQKQCEGSPVAKLPEKFPSSLMACKQSPEDVEEKL